MRQGLVTLILLVTVLANTSVSAKKIPPERMQFIHEYKMELERTDCGNYGGRAGIDIIGKEKEILELVLYHADVVGMQRFETECVEPSKEGMKRVGFRTVRIYSGEPSETYPKGTWDIPLN